VTPYAPVMNFLKWSSFLWPTTYNKLQQH